MCETVWAMQESTWWPKDATDLAGYATALAAVVTLLLFVVAWRQLRLVGRQVEVASEEMEAAKASAEAAQASAQAAIEASREAARSRVDAHSHRLVVLANVEPGALVDMSRRSMPGGGDLRLLDDRSLRQSRPVTDGEQFVLDRDAEHFVWFKVRGSVRNEGYASVKVRLDGEAQFDAGVFGEEVVLKPDESREFTWGAGFTAAQLVRKRDDEQPAREFLIVTAVGFHEMGVIDKVHLELASRALRPVPGNTAAHYFRDRRDDVDLPGTVAVVYPLQRIYRWDWDAGRIPAPPWPS